VLINTPARTLFLSPYTVKIEQTIRIELHVKPTKYDVDTIASFRTDFTNIKEEILRILNKYRFEEVGNVLNISGWIDARLPHGFGEQREPLELVSRLNIEIMYYKVESSV